MSWKVTNADRFDTATREMMRTHSAAQVAALPIDIGKNGQVYVLPRYFAGGQALGHSKGMAV
jgi:hypothetical protein